MSFSFYFKMLYQEWKFFYIENIYRNKFSKFKFILSEILNWIKRKKIGILIKYERLAADWDVA